MGGDLCLARTKPINTSPKATCVFLAKQVYTSRRIIPAQPVSNAVSIVCISDTHNYQPELPDGDILIHAGDLSQSGTFEEVQKTILWISQQLFEYKVVIAGNHDLILDPSRDQDKHAEIKRNQLEWGDIIYLENSSATLTCSNGRRLTVYGSPCSPQHGNWAFQYPRHNNVWSGTSFGDIDILVTHAPPRGHLDIMFLGCAYLLSKLWQTQPLLHLQFDALQEAYERTIVARGGIFNLVYLLYRRFLAWFETPLESRCLLVNPAIVGGIYDEKKRKPIRVII
ncbi:unnamed protein product [Clonostachys chloroleuca]|uniref:Calcineurin-like phosphoesterase domain-containing protein n=1 Tax=Clonostachys chloroleuca TaxID=1926264 RepID=A0AA35PT49_9HYPO|nr:unnamed protein product [Clonostachys chloroleuca]